MKHLLYILRTLPTRFLLAWRQFVTFGIPVVAPPHPNADALAKARGTHYFIVKVTWDANAQTWFVEIPEIKEGILTNHDTLPGALAMAGDAAMLLLEMDMQDNNWPRRDETDVYFVDASPRLHDDANPT